MQKPTIYLIILAIVAFLILGVLGEYFTYKYYSLVAATQNSPTAPAATPSPTQSNVAHAGSGSAEDSILSFNFQDPLAVGSINESNQTITLTVPPVADVTKITPSIDVSQYATISPSQDTPQDFTNPVTYTVTAQDGATKQYVVTVNVASILTSAEKNITSFKISGIPTADITVDNTRFTVYAVVPDGTDLTNLTPVITVSDGATISPQSGVQQDFTNPVIYTVTDRYGSTQQYTVTILNESNSG